ncbi:retron St85 family RNA-directed DNA polymerase [Serratia sp. CY81684]|uniref:retron St85 family RNA-directed DNA polymerase n=1 Tax=Serratia TaxID=613 RepID=UPI0024CB3B23|nr:retron St85 family RNA-directed DNA polymerase [Serratia marcescens]MDI3227725.1 retron St85 family RNA-directed DNA polymerase [Serratia marcescens]WAZ17185.1 retron St85 family RNA-directed DNA polymerase [Serratia marcescens]HEN7340873.1 retron St85 family RNA-directed DNA polymerase [Serratia marcescens]HEN7411615.1 retron St85 family RNA-directed DNA polymerase [Serratia marcescens]
MTIIKQLALGLGRTEADIVKFLVNAPKKYKVYTIPKRTSGHRVIAQPSKELKVFQRKFMELYELPVHKAAMAYREKLSIKNNAQSHQKNNFLLKIDLENFFNSINCSVFWKEWLNFYPLPGHEDKLAFENLLFWAPSKALGGKLILSIGAPSSPLLSNFIMHRFDEIISRECSLLNVTYTRYADDLTFSTDVKNVLFDIPDMVEKYLLLHFEGALKINKKKTIFSSKAHNRHVTGVTLNNDGELSLGRERKRYIKHLIYQYKLNRLNEDNLSHLKGLLAFSHHIEPVFIQALIYKYSAETINKITGR